MVRGRARDPPAGAAGLRPPSRGRRLFTHFFDVHFLEERGRLDPVAVRGEMDLAFRFALLLSDHVLVPASSYHENPDCRALVDAYPVEVFADRISLVASGVNHAEFIDGKLGQYGAGEPQGAIYRRAAERLPLPWCSRGRSATADIAAAWRAGVERDGMERIARALAQAPPADFGRRVAELPGRLERSAFIAPNASRLLLGRTRPTLQFTNRLLGTINDAYFGSYALDLGAAVVQELVWLASPRRVPSGDPPNDVEYRALREACRATGLLGEIARCPAPDLLRFRGDERFASACEAAHGAALGMDAYRRTNELTAAPEHHVVPSGHRPSSTKVLVVTALPEELAAVVATCDETRTLGVAGDRTIYRLCVYRSSDGTAREIVVATASDMGKANAAALAANALRSFPDVEHVLMVGIAGGCPDPDMPDEHVRLGDVVVSDHHGIVEYDDVKLKAGVVERRGAPQVPSAALLQAVAHLKADSASGLRPWEGIMDVALARLVDADDPYDRPEAGTDRLHAGDLEIPHPEDRRRRANRPRVFGGAIATGDALVKDPSLRDDLRRSFGARAIEMEGSAVRSAAWAVGKDAIVVRGVSDYCDGHKNDQWRYAAALAAAAYARALIETLPQEWFR